MNAVIIYQIIKIKQSRVFYPAFYCKQIEILEEQVCLRDEFIEKIVDKCDQSGSKKDLIRYIKTEFEKGCLGC